MGDQYIWEKNQYGEMRAVFALNNEDHGDVLDAINMTSDFNEKVINDLFIYLEQQELKVGLLTKVYIHEDFRGKGHSREFLQAFKDKVMPHTDIDLVFARISNPQAKGFNLLSYYGALGFEPVHFSAGDMLMVSKGYAVELRDLLCTNYKNFDEELSSNNRDFSDDGMTVGC
jgi:GNAT superfamily N-acetyltransferase